MKTIQATDDLTLEIYPPPAGQQPLLVLRSRAAEIDEECPEGIAVYVHAISDVIKALAEAAAVLTSMAADDD